MIQKLERDTHMINVDLDINVCRDPKDNKFLELAITANASCIITGDLNLLVLHPFNNILILSTADFLRQF